MDIQNHFYGHSAALALAAGLPRPRHIPGLLQHGWTVTSPAAVHGHDFPQVGVDPRWSMFVWSHSSRAWSPREESRASRAIGSPFLYLQREARAAGWQPAATLPTVWIPFHGTRLVRIEGDQRALAREVFEREGQAVVCLHVEDADDPEIVGAWRDAGHRLVTAGRRKDPEFLGRILNLVGSARRVASNRLGTAVLYAAALGKDVAVYGPPMALPGEETRVLDRMADLWPEFQGDVTDVTATTATALLELGSPALLSASELRSALGWDKALGVRPAAHYWVGSSLRKAAVVLGLARRASDTRSTAPSLPPSAFLRHPLAHLPSPLPRRLPTVPHLPVPIPVGDG